MKTAAKFVTGKWNKENRNKNLGLLLPRTRPVNPLRARWSLFPLPIEKTQSQNTFSTNEMLMYDWNHVIYQVWYIEAVRLDGRSIVRWPHSSVCSRLTWSCCRVWGRLAYCRIIPWASPLALYSERVLVGGFFSPQHFPSQFRRLMTSCPPEILDIAFPSDIFQLAFNPAQSCWKEKLINTGVGSVDHDDGDSTGDVLAASADSARSPIGTSARSAVRKHVFTGWNVYLKNISMLFTNGTTISKTPFMMLNFVECIRSQSVQEIDDVVLVAGDVRVVVGYFVD